MHNTSYPIVFTSTLDVAYPCRTRSLVRPLHPLYFSLLQHPSHQPRSHCSEIQRCQRRFYVGCISQSTAALFETTPHATISTSTLRLVKTLHPKSFENTTATPLPELLALTTFTRLTFCRVLQSMKRHSTLGPDGMRNSVLRALKNALGGTESQANTLYEFTAFVHKQAIGKVPIHLQPYLSGESFIVKPMCHSEPYRLHRNWRPILMIFGTGPGGQTPQGP